MIGQPQHYQQPQEACFQAATEALMYLRRRQGKPDLEIDHQRYWTKSVTSGQWRPEDRASNFRQFIEEMFRTLAMQRKLQKPDDGGRWDTGQMRCPDVTVYHDGKHVVIDTKFDRKDGTRDKWNTAPGRITQKDQRTDYNEINEQQTGRPNQDLSLDADTCKCPPGREPEQVEEVDPNMLEMPSSDRKAESAPAVPVVPMPVSPPGAPMSPPAPPMAPPAPPLRPVTPIRPPIEPPIPVEIPIAA